jgi:hypothetical protein
MPVPDQWPPTQPGVILKTIPDIKRLLAVLTANRSN